eukprot:TRINITY_DN14362_c0_g1_i1.p1 TRINITY_DN14362_c0_g1~~TRINITY_DN14362_c0_g1_i1.p1  ORF type:complete len:270 (+),score=25.08 TRINITY_DN14362_c0_g1_i1:3-812(+)
MKYFAVVLALCLLQLYLPAAHGHARLVCPRPRSDSASLKSGPCGDQPTSGPLTTFRPGNNTIVFEETISHAGAPFRFALAFGDEVYDYVLLDHVPHNDASVDTSLKPYRLNIEIPDIDCPSCSLQMMNFMVGSSCSYSTRDVGDCSLYTSCANIKITGSQSIAAFKASYVYNPPSWWPYRSSVGTYTQERATWATPWLSGMNATDAGPCTGITALNQNPPSSSGNSNTPTFSPFANSPRSSNLRSDAIAFLMNLCVCIASLFVAIAISL